MNKYPQNLRKASQLKRFSQSLLRRLRDGSFDRLTANKKNELVKRVAKLRTQLSQSIPNPKLAGAMAMSAMVIGVFHKGKAQVTPTFAAPVDNPFGITVDSFSLLTDISFADLDGDGDLDAITMNGEYYYSNKAYYWENTGTKTNPVFTLATNNPLSGISENVLFTHDLADLDGDGDQDFLTGLQGYYSAPDFKYYQNVGTSSNPTFALPTTNPYGLDTVDALASPVFVDIDGDGDLDLFSGEYVYYQYTANLVYFENTGTKTSPMFATQLNNPFGYNSPTNLIFIAPAFSDLDQDGDLDMIVGEVYYGEFWYYENTGNSTAPAFTAPVKNPFGLVSMDDAIAIPNFVDIDGDGDDDLFVGGYYGEIKFYENTSPVSRDQPFGLNDLKIYPNPADEKVWVSSELFEGETFVKVMDLNGRTLFEKSTPGKTFEVNTGSLSPGLYLMEIRSGDRRESRKIRIE